MRPPRCVLGPLRSERLIRAVDRVLLAGPARGAAGTRHVLLAPPGRGNIGDQALVESFVEAVDAPVTVLVRSPDDFDVPADLTRRMELLAVPALVYGSAFGHARDIRRLNRAMTDARSFSVVGADIMDGAYVVRASVNRANLAARIAAAGWDARVLGFSWNDSPVDAARAALARAGAAGTTLLVRDPASARRARSDGLDVVETADIVFTASSRDDAAADRLTAGLGDRPLALVNASGLVGPGHLAYREVVAELRSRGHRVVIVPHVSRHGADDLPVCAGIAAEFADDPEVVLVDRLLSPREIRGLGARADVVVTGRMHLAVMSLIAGTPAITISTQGKVEGLMQMFDTPMLCVAPGEDLPVRLPETLRAVLRDRDDIAARIRTHAPDVVERAWRNVAGLRASVPTEQVPA